MINALEYVEALRPELLVSFAAESKGGGSHEKSENGEKHRGGQRGGKDKKNPPQE